jgi:DNA-directed RNA polymerase specialized sigma24 family protein
LDYAKDIDDKDKLREVFDHIKKLKKEHRDVFLYRIWDDLSYKEISEITGI